MAIRITRIDDIDGSDGAEAIAFALDRKGYEIDLCVRNKIRFLRAIEPFVEHARIVEQSEEVPKITTIVRTASEDRIEEPEFSSYEDSATDREPQGLDLIEMARQVQG
jgi:Lsr2